MLRIIAYDIPDDKRRRKVMEICKDYGVRQQFSVFVSDLEEEVWQVFLARLTKTIDVSADSVIVYPLCAKCRAAQIALGQAELYEKPLYYLF